MDQLSQINYTAAQEKKKEIYNFYKNCWTRN